MLSSHEETKSMSKSFGRFFRGIPSYPEKISNLEVARFSDRIYMGDHSESGVTAPRFHTVVVGLTSSSQTVTVSSGRDSRSCSEPNAMNSVLSSLSFRNLLPIHDFISAIQASIYLIAGI